jgi:hypothetical protein
LPPNGCGWTPALDDQQSADLIRGYKDERYV